MEMQRINGKTDGQENDDGLVNRGFEQDETAVNLEIPPDYNLSDDDTNVPPAPNHRPLSITLSLPSTELRHRTNTNNSSVPSFKSVVRAVQASSFSEVKLPSQERGIRTALSQKRPSRKRDLSVPDSGSVG